MPGDFACQGVGIGLVILCTVLVAESPLDNTLMHRWDSKPSCLDVLIKLCGVAQLRTTIKKDCNGLINDNNWRDMYSMIINGI
jgi:hypothetical protein